MSANSTSDDKVVRYPDQSPEYGVLVPEGNYQLKLVGHYTAIKFNAPRLILVFRVIDYGQFHGCLLERYFYVKSLKGKPGKNGGCIHKPRGDFMIEYLGLFPEMRKPRLDRVSLQPLYENVITARIATVTRNNQQKKMPEQLHYSKVAELIEVAR